ncbi:hypothetical protein TSYNTROPHJE_20250 [Tepidanaerobacter syntrophicus]|uniref:YerC/YecD family TrpR-related protein n=1 Tax=Tepidanaerobacter syntrophicus TaxID=224999 RepID=UPI0022ED536F|nr:YerC/YecD family TrpR-related protein [Tepidanaerobacter syntrophicus]GLI20212.1 hypothetical protein TSYNTROPHJE_20250 [Tepidanaerobacter syntrophicus]
MRVKKVDDPYIDQLFEAILLLKDKDECYRFFQDICTVGELQAMAQRLQVAIMLKEGRTYTDIAEATGASTATISRVKRFLHYGSDGYNLVLERLEKSRKQEN